MRKKWISIERAFEIAGLEYPGYYNSRVKERDFPYKEELEKAGVYCSGSIDTLFNHQGFVKRDFYILEE